MKNFNSTNSLVRFWAGQGIRGWLFLAALALSAFSVCLTLYGFKRLHEPAQIEVICPENLTQSIQEAREEIESLRQ